MHDELIGTCGKQVENASACALDGMEAPLELMIVVDEHGQL